MGKAWVFEGSVDTDVLAPGQYMKFGIEEIARHCMESIEPRFAREVRPGDVVVGPRNFGLGSSREQAPAALRQLGVAAVLAPSFAGLFYRNAVNVGLLLLECADCGSIRPDDQIEVDAAAGLVHNRTQGHQITCRALPAHLRSVIEAGGLLPWLEQRMAKGDIPAQTAPRRSARSPADSTPASPPRSDSGAVPDPMPGSASGSTVDATRG